jgi:hypothetical protein
MQSILKDLELSLKMKNLLNTWRVTPVGQYLGGKHTAAPVLTEANGFFY